MKQTPSHEMHNPDLLEFIPRDCRKVIEVGCSSGAMAREYRKINPDCRYHGVEIDPDYAELARRHCDEVSLMNIETAPDEFFASCSDTDCWVFGDSLEHLVDPWKLLTRVAQSLHGQAKVVACIPNAQHWSVQARLCCGEFRYEPSGLLDRTHLRWFTRITIIELFHSAGLKILEGSHRIFDRPEAKPVLEAIGKLAEVCGADPGRAISDATPLQWLIKAARA